MKKLSVLIIFILLASFASAETLSLSTVNVWSGLTYRGFFGTGRYEGSGDINMRYQNLLKELKRFSPDIIAINEANPLPSYAKKLAGDLEYSFVHNVSRGGVRIGAVGLPANLREGEVILAKEKFQLEKVDSRLIKGGPSGNFFSFQIGKASQVLAGKVTVGRREIYVFVTQWVETDFSDQKAMEDLVKSYSAGNISAGDFNRQMRKAVANQETRLKQAEATLNFINEIAAKENVILMGSLNAKPDSPEMKLFRDAGFTDVFEKGGSGAGVTYDARYNTNITDFFPEMAEEKYQLRLDYIFIRGNNLSVRDARVFLNRASDGKFPSDHYGVYATINVN